MSTWSMLLLVPVLIALNAFFVAAEYAIVAIRATQIEALRIKRRSPAVAALASLKANPAPTLAAIQVCITMTNLLLGWIGEPAISGVIDWMFQPLVRLLPAHVVHTLSFIIGFVIVTLLTVVFSELVPKAMTLRFVEPVALFTSLPVLGFRTVTWPLVKLMNGLANVVLKPLGLGGVDQIEKQTHTSEEIRLIAAEAAEDGVLTGSERSLILNTLSLGKRKANQIMVSRISVDYLDLRRSMQENLRVLEANLHSRLPLCDGGMDKVFGVVSTKEFLMAYEDGGDSSVMQLIARPAVFVPETLTVDKLLPIFSDQGTQMLFLVSEYGGVEGIVTLKDVLDELLRPTAPEPLKPPAQNADAP